jgi:menaquinol-cytochrome c reductase iron-sulfur subunit
MGPAPEEFPAPRPPPEGIDRRRFLRWSVLGGGLALAGVAVGPPFLTVLAPAWQGRGRPLWVDLGRLTDFELGQVTKAVVQVPREDWAEGLRARGVFVWRPEEEAAVVFSRACTDLGCPVTWDPGSGWYFCPCHGAIFDQEGVPQKGPPRRPLHRYAVRREGEMLQIDLNSVPPLA